MFGCASFLKCGWPQTFWIFLLRKIRDHLLIRYLSPGLSFGSENQAVIIKSGRSAYLFILKPFCYLELKYLLCKATFVYLLSSIEKNVMFSLSG